MVKQHRNQSQPRSQPSRVSSGVSSFWNNFDEVRLSCNENSQQYLVCAPATSPDFQEYADHLDDDDDDSIVEPNTLNNQEQDTHRVSQQMLPTTHRVRSIVDGFIAPFMKCMQPPIQTCMAQTNSWDPERDGNRFVQIQERNVKQYYVAPDQAKNAVGKLLVYRTPTNVVGDNMQHNKTSSNSTGSLHISPNDVLCGRGNSVNQHIGNVRFRELIDANKDDYATLTKKEKIIRASEIVDLIMHHTDPPGRFVARDSETGLWHDIGMPRSLEKTSQALREKSTAEKVAGSSHMGRATSTDGNDTADVEVTAMDQPDGSNILSFCRATTITVKNHRNGKSLPPPIIVPDHLRGVYKKEPTKQNSRLMSLPPTQHTTHSKRHQLHAASSGLPVVAPTLSPHKPAFHGPIPISDTCRSHFLPPVSPSITVSLPPSSMQAIPTSPRHTSINQYPLILPSVLVTPLGKNCNHQPSPPRVVKAPVADDPCKSPLVEMKDVLESRSTIWSDGVKANGPKSPIFPSDVFQNPSYDTEAKNAPNDTQFRWKELLHDKNDDAISPSRQQSYPKRQRMSKNLLDISFDSAFLEVDTSMESIETTVDTLDDMDLALVTGAPDKSAAVATAPTIITTHRLVEAIGSQLTLDDKVIRSPSELVQTFTRGRNQRKIESLPRPCKATPPLDISADSADGLAALSTAAFLRLDESF